MNWHPENLLEGRTYELQLIGSREPIERLRGVYFGLRLSPSGVLGIAIEHPIGVVEIYAVKRIADVIPVEEVAS